MDNEFYLSIGGISPEVSLEHGLHPLDVLRKASHIKRICEIEKNFRFANFFPTSQIRRHVVGKHKERQPIKTSNQIND